MTGKKYGYDEQSLLCDGKRFFPMMGELHYSRYPKRFWKEALCKMKAGGIDIVSSYVIWIHHEEIEDEWDWAGDKDLRTFVKTIGQCGLKMILRIGPWVHAEVRNGGFPDWLLSKCPKARTNDKAYFWEVEKFYRQIFSQVQGLLLKDGGPIIGLQIENEFGHCGGLCGDEGLLHMQHLEKMARDIGFDVPLYTATGWGGAVTAGLLPVMGGYCEAPWDPRISEIEPSGNYLFTYERNDHAIGCDFGLGEGVTFDMTKVPYLTAELGGGLQVTYKRRPVALACDIGAMSLAKMGSGCNLLGYYMYHGGKNPDGKLTSLEESIKSGSLNDLPEKNYDFRAALGEYGQPSKTFGEIKRLALFVHDYGRELCSMKTFIPENSPQKADNYRDLRTSFRYDEKTKKGYLFVNNFQRRKVMESHNEKISVPESLTGPNTNEKINVCVKNGDYFFMPFSKDDSNYSYYVPLCRLENEGKNFHVVYPLSEEADEKTCVKEDQVLLSREDSLSAFKVKNAAGGDELLLTEGIFYENSLSCGDYLLAERGALSFKLFPPVKKDLPSFERKMDGDFETFTFTGQTDYALDVQSHVLEESENLLKVKIKIPCWADFKNVDDIFIRLHYVGNCARLYLDGKLVDDSIFTGEDFPWEIGLKSYGKEEKEFILEVDALDRDAKIFIEKWPLLQKQKTALLKKIDVDVEYKINVNL